MTLTHFSTFSGIGGMDLAAEWAGFETVGQVEKADFPYRVLCKHWPNVPKWRDIKDVGCKDEIGDITVLSGGFPCQPFSSSGKRKGEDDDRYLWPEMFRVISELRPRWVVGENVAGIVDMALDKVQTDLENQGYTTRAFIIPAISADAPHRRDRVFIVAHDDRARGQVRENEKIRMETGNSEVDENTSCVKYAANVDGLRCDDGAIKGKRICGESSCVEVGAGDQYTFENASGGEFSQRVYSPGVRGQLESLSWDRIGWPEAAARLCRVDDGVPNRVDRLRSLGNAVVPQAVYPIFKCIAEIENRGMRLDDTG